MALLEATVVVVDFVVVVVTDNIYIQLWPIKVNLSLLNNRVEFLWWWVGWGLHSHFCVQPNYSVEVVLWLCCVVVGVVTIFAESKSY